MVSSPSILSDLIIVAGTATVGALMIDLHRRLPQRLLVRGGVALVLTGWIATLIMTASGPYPHATGAAIGGGLFLAGLALLLPGAQRALRSSRNNPRR